MIANMDADALEIYGRLWDLLEEGRSNRHHAFHTPVFATRTLTGEPDMRTVVLRRVDRDERLICCHTDSRSPKVSELRACARVGWLFYDQKARVQIRAHGHCTVHSGPDDTIAFETWRDVKPDSRVCYSAPYAPSVEVGSWESNQPSDEEKVAARSISDSKPPPESFSVLATVLDSIEWLELHHDGHRRIRFRMPDATDIKSNWLTP